MKADSRNFQHAYRFWIVFSAFLFVVGLGNTVNNKTSFEGDVGEESLPVINALAWHEAGYTGKGIKIGILDQGFEGYEELLGTELPEHVTIKIFNSDDGPLGSGEHGTAVTEVVHDIAPDAELYLASYITGTQMGSAVDWLISQDVDIIQHSRGFINTPMDGTGWFCDIVEEAANRGILWVNSAGNNADKHYSGQYTDTDGNTVHEFFDGSEFLSFYPFGVTRIGLSWDDWESRTQDIDLVVVDADGNLIIGSSDIQNGSIEPTEFISYEFGDEGPYFLAIIGTNITRNVNLNLQFFSAELDEEYIVREYSLLSPGDSPYSLTVGATYWQTDELESYSSWGPSLDGRLKPEISAPTGISSAAFEGEFYGTSASAPHVSAASALVMQAYPAFSPQDVRDYLMAQSIDLGDPGEDILYGAGRLWLGDPPLYRDEPPVIETAVTEETEETEEIPVEPSQEIRISATPIRVTPEEPRHKVSESSSVKTIILITCISGLCLLAFIGLVLIVLIVIRNGNKVTKPSGASQKKQATCPYCHAPVAVGMKYCPTCKRALQPAVQPSAGQAVKYCKKCGTPVRQGASFCAKCGEKQ